ncbi:hypothetical protein O9993_07600 [Vibrio lentus]|nr:hypothetical protein [Vibrio lentus]
MLDLLAQRLALVEKVGEVKVNMVYLFMYRNVKPRCWHLVVKKPRKIGVPPQLIEDILRRTMRDLMPVKKILVFKCLNPELRSRKWLSLVVMVNLAVCLVVCSSFLATKK